MPKRKHLVEKLQRRLFKNLNNEKYTHLLKTIFGLLIMEICRQLISKHDKRFRFLLSIIDIYSKHAGMFL